MMAPPAPTTRCAHGFRLRRLASLRVEHSGRSATTRQTAYWEAAPAAANPSDDRAARAANSLAAAGWDRGCGRFR